MSLAHAKNTAEFGPGKIRNAMSTSRLIIRQIPNYLTDIALKDHLKTVFKKKYGNELEVTDICVAKNKSTKKSRIRFCWCSYN